MILTTAGQLLEGYQSRIIEFINFERKFEVFTNKFEFIIFLRMYICLRK